MPALGAGARKSVGVQIPPPAPFAAPPDVRHTRLMRQVIFDRRPAAQITALIPAQKRITWPIARKSQTIMKTEASPQFPLRIVIVHEAADMPETRPTAPNTGAFESLDSCRNNAPITTTAAALATVIGALSSSTCQLPEYM